MNRAPRIGERVRITSNGTSTGFTGMVRGVANTVYPDWVKHSAEVVSEVIVELDVVYLLTPDGRLLKNRPSSSVPGSLAIRRIVISAVELEPETFVS